jgi:GDSL-like Lipase/Acylhydrolase family
VGHVPNPGFQARYGNSVQTIDSDGLRSTGETPPPGEPVILAVGDSFTFGDEVNDGETWPAYLQRLTGRRVLNGGVTGYGFDQIVLRAEQLAVRFTPSVIIVSFIEDDLTRTEMRAMWWRDKPWFAIEDGRLVLKAAGAPDWAKLPRRIHSILGRCFNKLSPTARARAQWAENRLVAALPPGLQHRLAYFVRAHPPGVGLEIAKRLIEQLAKLQVDRGLKVVMMAQYTPAVWLDRAEATRQRHATQAILDRATACGLATLDTFQRLASETAPRRLYANFHMNARGNAMIATLLAATLPGLLANE